MVLGAVWCPLDKTREIAVRLREIKTRHNFPASFETKWSKVSAGKLDYYMDVLDYFFDDDDLSFRALIVSDKAALNHAAYSQNHDTWYYKMYFVLLKMLLSPQAGYRIYLDIKDTRSATKVAKLSEVLTNSRYDFDPHLVEVQNVRSHEIEQLQLADLLIGIISYKNRGLNQNSAKSALVQRAAMRSKYNLTQSTLPREKKFNIFRWGTQEPCDE